MKPNREFYNTVQWNNVLCGLPINKALQEISDTTLKIQVLKRNNRLLSVTTLKSTDCQRYIYVGVMGDIIVEVMYVGQ